jgi:hypothetical protein
MDSLSPTVRTRLRAAKRLLMLLVAVLGILAVGTTTVASASTATRPATSSGSAVASVLKTRVGVAATPIGLFVGLRAPGNPASVGRMGCNYDGFVSGSCVATKPGVPAPEPVVKPSGAPDRSSAVYVNVEMPDGTIRTVGSQTGSLVHAEDAAQALSPGGRMSQPYGWRMGPDGKVTWQPIDVCATCQGKYPPSMFPSGTSAAPGGAWTSK